MIARDPGCRAGLLAFYNDALYAGLAFDDEGLLFHRYGMERGRSGDIPAGTRRLHMRMTMDRHILIFFYRTSESEASTKMKVSGYHHNVNYGFLSLRPGLYSAGQGSAHFDYVRYRALDYFETI